MPNQATLNRPSNGKRKPISLGSAMARSRKTFKNASELFKAGKPYREGVRSLTKARSTIH